MMDKLAANDLKVAEMVRQLAKGMAAWLKFSRWREGTMLTSTAVGAVPGVPQLHAAIKETLDEWRQRLIALLIKEGRDKADAQAWAQTLVASLEGAMILARIDQDERVLLTVADLLASTLEAKHR
jgi:TetR/AcrR family transcriptional regulator, lmrAB and yxaGH operons repressor